MSAPAVTRAYVRPRAYVRVQGPDAGDLLQRVVSNDVLAGEACEALLLTSKGRVIAPILVWRRGEADFLLLTEPELGETVRAHLVRARMASRCEIEPEDHVSAIVFGDGDGIPNREFGVPAVELLDAGLDAEQPDEELERLRILARSPRWGREIDEGILPAEAGLDERAVSFTKGCYPGQEPLARLRNRGHVNRTLRVLEFEGETPHPPAEVRHEGRVVGRITSAVPGLALAFVRVEVPDDAELEVEGRRARLKS
jgi:folate-binding protein YgfZ